MNYLKNLLVDARLVDWLNSISPYLLLIFIMGVSLVVGILLRRVVFFVIRKIVPNNKREILRYMRSAIFLLFPLLFFYFLQLSVGLDKAVPSSINKIITICVISMVSWLSIKTVSIVKNIFLKRYDITKKDNGRERKIHTQFQVIEKIIVAIVVIIAISSILMTFDSVKRFGVSLLASAGLFGVVAALAAQKTISTVFAGIQIALTQPIKIDDVVVVEGEWGKIEELTLTYAVVRIWDRRTLILPISYFIEQPFQNWTKNDSELLGTVFIYTDYTVPLDVLRDQLTAILKLSPLWDKKVGMIQVTDSTERSMEVRCLVSADDSSRLWDLRCFVREGMIDFLQKNFPETLPQERVTFQRVIR